MKDYLKLNNNDYDKALDEIKRDVEPLLIGKKVNSSDYGEMVITGIMKLNKAKDFTDIVANFDYKILFDEDRLPLAEPIISHASFYLRIAMTSGALVPEDETLLKIVTEYSDAATEIAKKKSEELAKRWELEREKAAKDREERAARIEQEKKEAKIEAQKTALMKRAKSLSTGKPNFTYDGDFYTEVGFIAKHAKRVSAVVPDFLDSWFTGEFGNVERRVVDTAERSSGGFLKQWSIGLTVDLDTLENLPAGLERLLSQSKATGKRLANTEYIFYLVKMFDFEFGKKQDINKIADCIPNDRLESFNYGLSL